MIAAMTEQQMIEAMRHRYQTDARFHAEVCRAAMWALTDAPRLPDPDMQVHVEEVALEAALRALWLRDSDIPAA